MWNTRVLNQLQSFHDQQDAMSFVCVLRSVEEISYRCPQHYHCINMCIRFCHTVLQLYHLFGVDSSDQHNHITRHAALVLGHVQYIPRNMHTVFALLCFVVVIHWLISPYPPGLLHWHCGNLTIAPVPAKQPWLIWINTSCEIIMNDYITTTKQSTTKPCAYFLGYTVWLPQRQWSWTWEVWVNPPAPYVNKTRQMANRAPYQYKDRLIYVWRFPC